MSQHLGLRKLAKDSSLNLIRQIWSMVLGLATSIVVARALGAEARGIYAVAVLLPTLIVTFLSGGISSALVYYVARSEFSLLESIHGSLIFSLITSLIGVIVGLALTVFAHTVLFPGIPTHILLLTLILVPITFFRDNSMTIFQGIQDFRAYNLVAIIPQGMIFLLTLVLVWWLQTGVEGAAFAVIVGNFVSLVMVYRLLARRVKSPLLPIRFQKGKMSQLLSFGLRAHFSTIVAFLNYRSDVFLLNLLVTKASVGLYDVAVSLGERLWVISGAVSMVIYPRVASLENESDKRELTVFVTRALFWFNLVISLMIYVLAEWIIVLLYGEDFRNAALGLRLLLPGIVFWNITRVLANDIAGRGKPEITGVQAAISAGINIAANLILIPYMDFLGSALATTLSYSILTFAMIFAFCRLSGARWYELIVPTRMDVQRIRRGGGWLIARLKRV